MDVDGEENTEEKRDVYGNKLLTAKVKRLFPDFYDEEMKAKRLKRDTAVTNTVVNTDGSTVGENISVVYNAEDDEPPCPFVNLSWDSVVMFPTDRIGTLSEMTGSLREYFLLHYQ